VASKPPPPLNPDRDEVAQGLRDLVRRYATCEPEELELKGILDRAPALLEAQLPRVDVFASLDLDSLAELEGQEQILEAFSRASHIPNMILALGEVMDQEQNTRALDPLATEALELLGRLESLLQRWAMHQGGLYL
jgi:hypothetical protein